MNGDSGLGKPPPPPAAPDMSPSKMNNNNNYLTSNYEHMRYPSITSSVYPNSSSSLGYSSTSQQHQQQHQSAYLNVPYPSKSPYSHESGLINSYSMSGNNCSPLPPPPPLPSFHHVQQTMSSQGHGQLVHPTPQQAQQSGQSYLDLSLNREHRGSAFEPYRKHNQLDCLQGSSGLSDSPLFHGLPPPPPPLTASDYK